MIRTLTAAVLLSLSTPALAQMTDHDAHKGMDHGTEMGMDHSMDHDHAQDAAEDAAISTSLGALRLADQSELTAAVAAGGQPVVAKVLGAVCDFCAVAMKKTFGKRDEVAAVHVDLDAKTLNLVLKPGATMDDETLRKLVKKAGYKVDEIARGDTLSGA